MRNFDKPFAFTVTGKGRFPIDMLRHDMAHPADAVASEAITGTGVRDVELVAMKRRYITPARWASFGWSISSEVD